MKTLLGLLLMLPTVANAAREFPSVAAYVDDVLGAKDGSNASCHVSTNYPSLRGCGIGDLQSSRPRLFGIFLLPGIEQGYLFIVERTKAGYIVKESNRFNVDPRVVWGINEMRADADDRFHIDLQYGKASTPTDDVYRFKLINGQWRVTGRDHSTMDRCSDKSIGPGTGYSANFLTGKVVVVTYEDCEYVRKTTHHLKFPPISWESFDPFDSRIDPEEYGLIWWRR
jgi:hypothetical protein